MPKVKKVSRRFTLAPHLVQQGSQIVLGTSEPGQPQRVTLSKSNPTVTGDEYGIYLTTGFIREIEPLVETVEEPDGEAGEPGARRQREFELTDAAKARDQRIKLGGYGAGDPPVVYLDRQNPRVVGDAYAMYLPLGYIREVLPVTSIKTAARALLEGKGKVSPPTSSLVDDAVEALTPAPAPRPALPEQAVQVETIPLQLPSAEDLRKMSRPELEDLARRLNIWDKVVGSGPSGYRTSEDLLRHFGVEVSSPAPGEEPLPRPSQIKKMSKDQLLRLAERLGVTEEVTPSGVDGSVTSRDLVAYLVPLVESRLQDGELDDGEAVDQSAS